MGPNKGRGAFINRKRKRAEKKKVDQKQNVMAAASASLRSHKLHQPLDWWENFSKRITGPLSQSGKSKDFESVLKISRKTFNYICSLVKDGMMTKPLNFTDTNGKPLSLNDRVAIAIRRLSSGDSLSVVGDSFGITPSTVSQITWRFVEAMEERALHHIHWPSTEAQMENVKSKFAKNFGLPNCCGAISSTRIVMCLPAGDPSNNVWIDSQNNHSMVLQAVVDADMRFLDIVSGWPGSLSESLVVKSSGFFKLCEEEKRLNGKKMKLSEGNHLREYIVGGAGYPLLPWLLTPYQGKGVDEFQAKYNKRHLATRKVAQRALARLKAMWRIIKGVMWKPDKHKLPRIILVCCLLHNILIDLEDEVQDELPLSYHNDSTYRRQSCKFVDRTGSDQREMLSLLLSGQMLP